MITIKLKKIMKLLKFSENNLQEQFFQNQIARNVESGFENVS